MGLSAILVCEVFSASVHAWVHARRPGASVPFGGFTLNLDYENPRSIIHDRLRKSTLNLGDSADSLAGTGERDA